MVMTTLPFLCPCATYLWASPICSSGYRLSITGFSFPRLGELSEPHEVVEFFYSKAG